MEEKINWLREVGQHLLSMVAKKYVSSRFLTSESKGKK